MTDDVARAGAARQLLPDAGALGRRACAREKLLDAQARFIRVLEKAGQLNRAIEFLPADDEIAERRAAKPGLTAPERAVLLAYCKMWLYDELLAVARCLDDEYVAQRAGGATSRRCCAERYAALHAAASAASARSSPRTSPTA